MGGLALEGEGLGRGEGDGGPGGEGEGVGAEFAGVVGAGWEEGVCVEGGGAVGGWVHEFDVGGCEGEEEEERDRCGGAVELHSVVWWRDQRFAKCWRFAKSGEVC